MRLFRPIVVLALAVPATLAAITPAVAARSHGPQTLFFDAIYTHARTAGPDANHVGHKQIAGGELRDAAGHGVGRFAFTCSWIRILAPGDALEHCSGTGQTGDGQLRVEGSARESDTTHTWSITAGTGSYRGAHGTTLVRDLGDTETIIAVTITPRSGVVLRAGVIARPAANASFISHANRLCAQASQQLAALPPFPLTNFDPLHPDAAQLPMVGAFFTGPGDPRPTFHTLDARLQALGVPVANRGAWTRTLRARGAALVVMNKQDSAALAANTTAFVDTVHASASAYRRIAITATVFGATRCVL